MEQRSFACRQCGAKLEFDPASTSLKCPYCGTENAVPKAEAEVREEDYLSVLATATAEEEVQERTVVKCNACAAETTLPPNVVADVCPFCGSPVVATATTRKLIKPRYLLPFAVTADQAVSLFRKWVNSLWFAPSSLKRLARAERSGLTGMYVPYWTYDCHTTSSYTGERGDYYWETQRYTTMEGGKSVTKTRQVRKTRWTHVSGRVRNNFDDILVLASHSLPEKCAQRLEPWDLQGLVAYDDDYLSGFRAESYQINVEQGFAEAKEIMDREILSTVRSDIGGDEQRVHSVRTSYEDITFKHILLPIWVSAYRYGGKVFRFLVNARTGEVQGERPWSWAKIVGLVIGIIAVAAIVYFATQR